MKLVKARMVFLKRLEHLREIDASLLSKSLLLHSMNTMRVEAAARLFITRIYQKIISVICEFGVRMVL